MKCCFRSPLLHLQDVWKTNSEKYKCNKYIFKKMYINGFLIVFYMNQFKTVAAALICWCNSCVTHTPEVLCIATTQQLISY